MMLKSDSWIRKNCLKNKMISPFVEKLVAKGRISYGLSSYGYDIRVANEYKVFTDVYNCLVDPKEFNSKSFVDVKAPYCIVPARSFALSRSVEYFKIPRGVLGLCIGKSTYARCGIVVNITPLEPEWEGHLTLEISNTTPLPAKIYSDEGIAQLIFLESDDICEISYKDRKGKYQSQRGVTLPRMKKG
ncbi:MAG: dCTP deaminase [Elusimicrobia bacterium GWC2_51_8]|nr:MAG: dCTP deaminase [Elusimicrobia bacterium GWA2_51_34]OGR63313.1 MAG: dCTP deaminase [Elusimicrobia bacterium GWC2_51_8]OGR84985.1 MAG: dCTP deaminase [Elusimicrobia bacterium GWF2_52_66]HAF95800.1 dCTP deaminase [Elusimicrobiota bacterium]HCE97130.1 dCTP deaminase [Elusimicrobiota bacterium]